MYSSEGLELVSRESGVFSLTHDKPGAELVCIQWAGVVGGAGAFQEEDKTGCLSQLQGQGSFLRSIWRWQRSQRHPKIKPGRAAI